jgi:hypothetical protein
MKTSIAEILDRDLNKLSDELRGYSDEALIWKTTDGISNSAGNLCLHLCGNLRHFIGATLGHDGYVRDREAEFAKKNIPRDKLISEIDTTRQVVVKTLSAITPEQWKHDYPLQILGEIKSTEFFMIHLVAHFNYHLGQINYHRRLIK